MFAKSLTLAVLTAATAVAALDGMTPVRAPTPFHPPSGLERRQFGCSLAEEECGIGCIPISYTCCPDGSGGCPLTANCQMGSNGEYGCCPIGRRCVGEGGVSTIPGGGGSVPAPTGGAGGDDDDDDDIDFSPQPTQDDSSPRPTGGIGGGIGDDDDDDDDDSVSGSGSDSGSDSGSGSGSGIGGDDDQEVEPTPTRARPPLPTVEDVEAPGAAGKTALSLVGAVGALLVAL